MSDDRDSNSVSSEKRPLLVFRIRSRVHRRFHRIRAYFHPQGIEKDMLRYRVNSASGLFGYLALLLDSAAFCLIYSTTAISASDQINLFGITSSGFWAGFDVFLNIVMLLFLFMAISKMKTYSFGWGVFSITQGAFLVVRPFLYPLALFLGGILPETFFILSTVFFLAAGVFLILAGFLSIYRGIALRSYLKTVKAIENEKVRIQ